MDSTKRKAIIFQVFTLFHVSVPKWCGGKPLILHVVTLFRMSVPKWCGVGLSVRLILGKADLYCMG